MCYVNRGISDRLFLVYTLSNLVCGLSSGANDCRGSERGYGFQCGRKTGPEVHERPVSQQLDSRCADAFVEALRTGTVFLSSDLANGT